jgi:hypothetical protein
MVLARDTIIIDSKEYPLARMKNVQGVLGTSARRWSATRKPLTAGITPRENVQRGEMPDEYVITYNDWSKGVVSDHDTMPGGIHINTGLTPYFPGRLISSPQISAVAVTAGTFASGTYTHSLEFNNHLYTVTIDGQYVYKDGNATAIKDFGAGNNITDAIVWNNELVVCFGTTKVIAKMDTSDVWDETGTNYATLFAIVEDRLWRAHDTNEVSNIGPGEDPQTATWSDGITVGDDDVPITDLNSYGERLAISKEDGLYMGDGNAIFPNVLPHIADSRDVNNGKGTVSLGSSILYPCHRDQLIEYSNGLAVDVGLNSTSLGSNISDTPIIAPSTSIAAVAAFGSQLYLVTTPKSTYDKPIAVFKTLDNGSTFSDYTDAATDNSITTYADVSALESAGVSGDYLYICYSGNNIYGLDFRIKAGNSASVLGQVDMYASGGTWSPTAAIDYTLDGDSTLARSGTMPFTLHPTPLLATFNGVQGYWVRFKVNGTLSSAVHIAELRILTSPLRSYLYRGTKSGQKYTWLPISEIVSSYHPAHCIVVGPQVWPYAMGGAVIVGAGKYILAYPLHVGQANDWCPEYRNGIAILAKDDGGMPSVNKQWLSITLKGKSLDANHTVSVYYREDETSTWNTAQESVATSPATIALTSITGEALQLELAFNAITSDIPTELNSVEVRYRLLDTYKAEIQAYLEIYDGLVPAATQLTALRALVGAGPKSITDPLGTARTVTFTTVDETEYISEGVDYPAMLVRVVCTET